MQTLDTLLELPRLDKPIIDINNCDISKLQFDGSGADGANSYRCIRYASPDLIFTDINGKEFDGYIEFDLRLYDALPEFDVPEEFVVTPIMICKLDGDDFDEIVMEIHNFYYPSMKCIEFMSNIDDNGNFILFNCEKTNNQYKQDGSYRPVCHWRYK